MFAQVDAPLNPLRAVFDVSLLAAITGAIVDHQYKKAGGVAPSRKNWLYLGFLAGVGVALLVKRPTSK